MRSLVSGPDLQLVDLALFLPQVRTLVIADIHLGLEDALHDEGVFVPRQHFAQVQKRLQRILAELEISPAAPLSCFIVNGDLRHQFGPLARSEFQETRALLAWLALWAEQIVLITGNHDGDLAYLPKSFHNCVVKRAHLEGSCWIVHGDEIIDPSPPSPLPGLRPPLSDPTRSLPVNGERQGRGEGAGGEGEIEWIVIGHEHPAVSLRDPATERTEVYKCFLVGRYRAQKLLVLPSFNQLIRGSDLTREAALSPYLRNLEDFSVYPVSDNGKIYNFGPLRRLLASV